MSDVQSFHSDLNAALAIAFQDSEDRFELDRHGMVTIAFDGLGEVVLQALPENDTLLLSTDVCPIARDDANLLRRALETNLFKVAPPGTFLAYDSDRGVLALCQSTGPRALQADGLMACLTAFVAGISVARSTILAPTAEAAWPSRFAGSVSDIIISG